MLGDGLIRQRGMAEQGAPERPLLGRMVPDAILPAPVLVHFAIGVKETFGVLSLDFPTSQSR